MNAGRAAAWKLLGAPCRAELEFIKDALQRDVENIDFGPAYGMAVNDREKAFKALDRIIKDAPE